MGQFCLEIGVCVCVCVCVCGNETLEDKVTLPCISTSA